MRVSGASAKSSGCAVRGVFFGSALMRPTTMTRAPGFATASTPCAMKNQNACIVHLSSCSSWRTTRTERRPRIGTMPLAFTMPRHHDARGTQRAAGGLVRAARGGDGGGEADRLAQIVPGGGREPHEIGDGADAVLRERGARRRPEPGQAIDGVERRGGRDGRRRRGAEPRASPSERFFRAKSVHARTRPSTRAVVRSSPSSVFSSAARRRSQSARRSSGTSALRALPARDHRLEPRGRAGLGLAEPRARHPQERAAKRRIYLKTTSRISKTRSPAGRTGLGLVADLFADQRARERARDADRARVDVALVGADDAVGDLFLGLRVHQLHGRAEGHLGGALELRGIDHLGAADLVLELLDAPFVEAAALAGGVVLGVLLEIAVRARLADHGWERRPCSWVNRSRPATRAVSSTAEAGFLTKSLAPMASASMRSAFVPSPVRIRIGWRWIERAANETADLDARDLGHVPIQHHHIR